MKVPCQSLARYIVPMALVVGVAGCMGLGKVLGTRFIDLPLGAAGTAAVEADRIAVGTERVRVDSIPFPERLWVANELRVGTDQWTFPVERGTGTVEYTMLIDGYPVATWTVEVAGGRVDDVTPTATYVPGMTRREDYEQDADREPIPSEQLQKMRSAFRALPASRRPALANDLSLSLVEGGTASEEEWGKIYRGVQSALDNRAFEVTVVARADGSVEGPLTLSPLTIKVFDSGQRLMGGMEAQ